MKAQQLKNSILQMAVAGKLVPQDSSDEPVSVLLDKIKAEKSKLTHKNSHPKWRGGREADGVVKTDNIIYKKDGSYYEKSRKIEKCIDEEIPFEIPESWVWKRINDIANVVTGSTPSKSNDNYYGSDYCFFKPSDISNDYNIYSSVDMLSVEGFNQSRKLNKNTIIVTSIGASIGKAGIIRIDGCTNQQINAIVLHLQIIAEYILFACLSPFFQKQMIHNASKTTLPIINKNKFDNLLIPLPPLAEQNRIVSAIEKAFKYIDEYDKCEKEITTLQNAFPEKLKKSILQHAVQGKLTHQDPNDEPVSVLLERIKAEKEIHAQEKEAENLKKKKSHPQKTTKKGKGGRIADRAVKNDSTIYKKDGSYYEKIGEIEKCINEEIPFDIPESWVWCRFATIVNYNLGKTPPRKESEYWVPYDYPWVSISDMIDGGLISETKEKVSQFAYDELYKNGISKKGTLLMSFKLTVGKTSILNIDAFHNEGIISIYPYSDENNSIKNYLFNTLPILSQLGGTKNAIKGNTLNSDSMNILLIPLPPLAEQERIVQKIESIFSKIDTAEGLLKGEISS